MTIYWCIYAFRVKREFTLSIQCNYDLDQKVVLWWFQTYVYCMKNTLGNKLLLYICCILNFSSSPMPGRKGVGLDLDAKYNLSEKGKFKSFEKVWSQFLVVLGKPLVFYSRCRNLSHFFSSQFSPVSTSSCVGQVQSKGQSNSLYLLQVCKSKVVGNALFLGVTKELHHGRPLKKKVEYVRLWFKMSRHNNPRSPSLTSLFHF